MERDNEIVVLPNRGNIPRGYVQSITPWGKKTLKINEIL